MSPKQADLIGALLQERVAPQDRRKDIQGRLDSMTSQDLSVVITELKSLPRQSDGEPGGYEFRP